ncbi:hydrocephalus-inducing protein homolog [Pectinophora gossypiella]|uniref:hydrocephalus-inducing protein homolog n=1 Tax=Pectinophora gossypiella TaxID=13191 RepID=UPI00214DF70C|nr:hydrocephalus-inducing protein homolog [Pectinophora gossypiella]
MVFKESTNFMIKPSSGELLSRLAPGISVTFAVTFVPTQFEDYVHRVSFYTDVDQYVVPLIALGPRPIFDFPDEIVMPPTPLKIETQVSLGVHNICGVPAGFTIATRSPFTIQPKSAYLFPNTKIELVVGFKTMHLGETVGKLTAVFETGEVFHIKVIATTHTVSIELEKSVVRFLDTYNTMVRHQTYKITNKSNELVTYMCMKNDSVYNDFEDKIKLATIFYNLKAGESEKYRKLVHYDVLSSDEHERVYTRIFYDEIQALVADETLQFQDTHFSILPIKGKLWPNKTTELTITFAPKEIGDFRAVAYLDIDGIYERVPLTMQGTAIPPSIYLHLETLDMDNVYINTKYNYEIVAINKGHINGIIMYKEVAPLFGSIISCTPEKHCLRPGEKETFTISFLNSNQGPYFEELNFVIPDTDVVRKLYLKGDVIYPSLTFSVPCLDFEKVSIGVPKTLQIEAINESVVNVKANVKISSDGPEISSITLEDCDASGSMQLETPQWPREFNIDPCNIELEAKSRITIKITLTANLCRANQTFLELELDKSDSPPIVLPIRYHAMVPEITPAPDIKLRACFLDFVYNYDIIISSNEFWGFSSIEQPSSEETLKVDVGMKRGLIRPNTTISLPATIVTEVLGLQEYTVRMHLFGLSQPIDICRIIANGVRPIVTCTPMTLQWGQTKLLTRTWKTLTLCNDSPVTVYFKAGLLNRDGKWTIDPAEGSIDPESETDLTLFLYLVDADTYTNKAVIQLEKVKDILVPLSATGVGTSIVVGPDRDHVNLGRHFVKIPLTYSVIMENCGTRLHSLEWLEHYKTPKTAKPPPLFFNLEPRALKLAGGEKVELKITGMALKVNVVKEIWFLIGSVEGVNKKELLLECPLVAEFVEPKVLLSTTQIDLQYDYGPYSEFYKLTDIMTIKNVSKLPLYIDVSIRPPFAIVKRAGTYKIDPEDEKMCCCICYDENDLNIQNIINECGPHQSKVFIDCLTLKPVEPLRKGPLEFFQDIHKIKMAFNQTHAVEERLEDQEIMKLQILFDTTKHLTLKSRIYADIMRIKFKGHKNKDAVKIMGRISFPNVSILTPKVDFQCILNGSVESKTIKLQNPTNLLACYNFKWKKCNIGTIPLPEVPMIDYQLNNVGQMKTEEPEQPSATTIEDVLPSPSEAPETSEKIGDTGDIQDPLLVGDDGEILKGVENPESESIDPEEEFRQMKIKILKKTTPMMEMDEDPGFHWTHKFPKMKKYKNLDLNDLFQLIPHRGILMPNSTQFVHVIFRPTYNVNVRAVLECEVLGGPSEFITISGKSSDLMFKLNSQTLNFKIRSFHEVAIEKLIITNISQLPFEYKTYLNEPVFDNDLRATIREIVPPEKVLQPEEETRVSINIQPGVIGYFHRVFLLEIGHLPHIPIESFGWGVIPQVYLTLPRPGLENLPLELGYEAIGTLTIDYLEAIYEFFCNDSSEHLNTPETEKCFEDPEFQVDWHICSAWDGYPDIMDIELAIERLLAVKHIKQRPEILTMYARTNKVVPIPGFSTIPYLIDFGVVITGSKTYRSVEIKNYGPLSLKLRFGKAVVNRFGLTYKLAAKMAPGESGRLDVTFAPTAYDFPELEQTFNTSITIEVSYGVTIPIQIKSLCAVPYLKCNIDKVDFGTVRCGDEKVTAVPLRNVGKPVCIWYVTLKQKTPGPCPTTMLETSGKYEAGEGGWLSISFKPIMEISYEGTLIFKFHMNPTKLTIPVVGQGVFPHAHIIGPRVVFPPTLPWADTTEIYLGITNPCPFPIELIMAHTDKKWKEEDEMYALLDRYYNKPEELLLPAVRPGVGMPPPVQAFFDRYKTNVQRNIEEEAALMSKARGATPTKRAKSPRKSMASSKHAQAEKIEKDASPRKYRTEAEIIAEMHCKEIAYALGMHLGIPTVSFDLCVVEALCTCECPARETLLTTINELYENVKNKTENQNDANGEAEDFSKWLQAYEEAQRETELLEEQVTKVMVYDEEEIKKIVDEFEEMDEEEYENANPELKQLYIRHGLEARKRKYFEKMGMPSDTFTNLDRPDKKSAKGKGKQSEVVAMQQMYQEYNKNVYEYLINIANNWIIEECEIGVPLLSFNGQLLGATQKKNKSKKSEVMLAIKKCECNQITDLNLLDDSTQDNVLNILSKWHCTCGKKPGCRDKLKITAAPTTIGIHNVLILFCIKDNPEIVEVNVSCCGVVPIVEILPATKTIDYNKILLYRREDERFIVKNDSILPIMWKVRNTEDFVEDFIISQTSGIIPRNDNKVVPVTYIACRVGIIFQSPLIIDIYDELGRGEPMVVDTLYLSAECYDVMVECAYENPNESYLNYGNVKVNSTEYREMYLLNRGKYNIFYKLKKVKDFPEPGLLKSFEADPETGVVPPTLKLVAIEFQCTPTTSMNLVNVPAYTCSLLDGSKDQVVVAKFPICVTIASFYNTFTLFPLGELNFHVIAVGSGVMRDVILNNTSKCPFNYEIIIPEQYRSDPQAVSQLPKGKDTKLKNPPIKCGNFLIVNEDNLLAPGTSRTIPIQFLATGPRRFEETIHFVVSDTCPSEAQGVPLRLVGTGAMPTLDFWNLDNTFREHLIVRNMCDYKVPESSPHCVFVEDSVTFHFFCVTVNSSHKGHIDMYNNGFVSCILTMKMHYQANTSAEIFSLDKYELQIEPLMHKRLGIIFSPKALKEYRAVLEVKLKLLHNQEKSFSLCITGEGVIPRIRLLKPPLWHHRLAVLRFPVTCLGSETNKIIRFKNISTITSVVVLNIEQPDNDRPVFWMRTTTKCINMVVREKTAKKQGTYIKLSLRQEEVASVQVFFNPLVKGRTNCEVKINIINNLYEFFTVLCEAEAFMEDVILIGLEMLSMDFDTETTTTELGKVASTGSTTDSKKKSKSAPVTKKKSKEFKKKTPLESKAEGAIEPAVLKYLLDFGGCEICTAQKRTAIMMNNSEKVYKFIWEEKENIVIKPTVGYISPAEEKDLEIMFFSIQPIVIKREPLICTLTAISDDTLTMDLKGATWDDRQTRTVYEHNQEISVEERTECPIEEQPVPPADFLGLINIKILYSATTEYTKYECNLTEEMKLKDTFIYQTRSFTFKVDNVGTVPMKITWNFYIDDEYPARIDKRVHQKELQASPPEPTAEEDSTNRADGRSLVPETEESKETLVSGSIGRESVDTWFEVDLPFSIEPCKECLKPGEHRTFKVTFKPLEAFEFRVCLKSSIDNLDPYDQNISCKIFAKSLIPYVHLDLEESDYLTSGRRTVTSVALPPYMEVLEFNVLGWGCYRKSFNVINPTNEGYEFVFETVPLSEYNATELVPVHCDMMKGFVEAGTSTEVTFTFAPTAPGVYESQWRFLISTYSLTIPLMVVGFVREPDVVFVPTIVVIKNSLVDFVSTHMVMLKNNENEPLRFEYKGNSLCNELGKEPITVTPERGTLKPLSETPIRISYIPIQDGPMSFKIFYHIEYMMQYLTVCVNALSYLVKPTVTYYIIGTEHVLDHKVNTRIHLEETASTYERVILFKIKNSGSATFFYDWHYTCTPVRKYLEVYVEPKNGYLSPGGEVNCNLHFQLRQVPVYEYPVSLSISDGPEYTIQLYAEIQKPLYHFSCKEFDFGKCIVNAPDRTYKKNLAFTNDDKVTIILDLNTDNVPELYVDFKGQEPKVNPRKRLKIPVYFRPKEVKHYEFKLQFWVNSLVEDIVTIRGEGVPLLVDLYEGCQKSFDLGPVKVGNRIVREIEVMNHSKVAIDAAFVFKNFYDYEIDDDAASYGTSICLDPAQSVNAGPSRIKMVQAYREDLMKKQTAIDIKNVMSSIKVVPSKCVIQPHRKVAIKILFKPVGLISLLKVQLNVVVLELVRPLVLISGSATGMSFRFSQDSMQFGRVRKRGCKVMKVKLHNEGDYGAKFWWQPLVSEEFTVFPMHGMIAARTSVSFVITYRPLNFNPYVKLWANLNIENYKSLELALYASCVDFGAPQNKTLYMECPVRSVKTDYVVVVNPTDEEWLVISEMEGTSFETVREFHVEANSSYEIPIHFKPKTVGKHEGKVLFSPLGESALFVLLIGAAVHPDPNGVYNINVPAKKSHTEYLPVYNITEKPETYAVMTELVKVVPDKFEGYYEIKCPETVKVWGEATATCQWTYICFEPCEMILKVMFVNEKTREYQFYEVNVQVTPSQIVATLKFVSRARESVQQEVKVANPLQQEAVFNIKCDKLSCAEVIKVARQSESKLQMTYSPLVVGEFEDYLTIENYIVGTYMYRVVATCLPAKEKSMEFTTSFGNCIPIRLRVQNKSDQLAHFNATVDHPAINVEKEYTLPANEKGKFLVWFEPTQLGVQNIKVSFYSSIAGEFVFRIKGTATEPKPQGPFDVKAGWSTVIKFKNVFDDHRTFKITSDREEFYVKSNLEQLKAKKDMRVTVYLVEKPAGGWKDPVTGTLTIETFEPAEPKVQWTYFLQGIP